MATLTAGARLWAAHPVRGETHEAKRLRHPGVGPLTLNYQAFDVRKTPGRQLVIHHAEPGSDSAHAPRLLGSVHATRTRPAPHGPDRG